MKKLIVIIASYLFVSCSVLPSTYIKTELNPSKREGMIVGTVSLENRKSIAESHSLHFNKDGMPKEINKKLWDSLATTNSFNDYYGSIYMKNSKGDFQEGEKWVYLFNIVKPAGNYKIYELELFLNTGYMQSSWKLPLEIPIEIEEGKIKYLGEINIKVKKGELQILNNIERDRIKFKEKFPNIIF